MMRGLRASLVLVALATLPSAVALLTGCPSLADIGVSVDSSTDTMPDRSVDANIPVEAGMKDADAEADAICITDANMNIDPHNCGRCGHDCLGGTCSAGVCQAFEIYFGDTPTSLTVDGPTLYVTSDVASAPNDGYLFRCTIASCQATKEVLATDLANPWFATLDGTTLFWVNGGGLSADAGGAPLFSGNVVSCPTVGGCPDGGPTDYTPDQPDAAILSLGGIAFDSTFLYWTGYSNSENPVGIVSRCATAACATTIATLTSGPSFYPFAVVVDKAYVYWTDIGLNQILRCQLPSCGGDPQIFANDQPTPQGIALYDGKVYWTQGNDPGLIVSCPASGCGSGPTTLASGQSNAFAIAVDETGVYWTDIDVGTLSHCPLGGCGKSPPAILGSAPAAYAIAMDAVSVYFTSSTASGSIWRVAKP
jgi:hypothetical protein